MWSAADFENFLEPRPDLAPVMEKELESVIRLLVEKRFPFRIHATYDETIDRFLTVFERVNRDIPFNGLRFIIDHAETITEKNIERVKALGGGVAVQHRMAFQGEYFIDRYGQDAAKQTPPITKLLSSGVPVGGGTDATRVASYNPWVSLYWLVSGKTLGGTNLYGDDNRIDRETALFLWTKGSAWFSGEEEVKGSLSPGQFADLAVLSKDFMTIEEEGIKEITSLMTVVGGKIVHASGEDFGSYNPPLPAAMPDWSPVNWQSENAMQRSNEKDDKARNSENCCANRCSLHGHDHGIGWNEAIPISDKDRKKFWGVLGCSCFAF